MNFSGPGQEHRVDFKVTVQQYLRFTCDRASLKSQIKSNMLQAMIHCCDVV